MGREEKIRACAETIAALYCPHEMHDNGADAGELFAETVHLIETDPAALIAWLVGF